VVDAGRMLGTISLDAVERVQLDLKDGPWPAG